MRRRLRPEETRLWALVAGTVRPARPHQPPPEPGPEPETAPVAAPIPAVRAPEPRRPTADDLAVLASLGLGARAGAPRRPAATASVGPQPIEPNRKRRIARAREPIGGRLDLHGFDQDQARAALHAFIQRHHAEGARAVLIITGKGSPGVGVLKQRAPEWLNEPPSRALVAGVSAAERRHGGEGALYVALKR